MRSASEETRVKIGVETALNRINSVFCYDMGEVARSIKGNVLEIKKEYSVCRSYTTSPNHLCSVDGVEGKKDIIVIIIIV